MPGTLSKPLSKEAHEALHRAKQYETRHKPPLPYSPNPTHGGKTDGTSPEKIPHIKLKVKIEADKGAKDGNLLELTLLKFNNGTEEQWVDYRKQMKKCFERQGTLTNPKAQRSMYEGTLEGKAREKFDFAIQKREKENRDHPDKEQYSEQWIVDLALNDVAQWIFHNWRNARRRQRRYMQRHLVMTHHPKQFFARVSVMNEALAYFPYDEYVGPKSKMDDEELLQEVLSAVVIPDEWEKQMILDGREPFMYDDIDELEERFSRLWEVDARAAPVDLDSTPIPRKKRKRGDEKRKSPPEKTSEKPTCDVCGKRHFGECRMLQKRREEPKKKFHKKFIKKEMANLATEMQKKFSRDMNKCFAAMKEHMGKQKKREREEESNKISANYESDSDSSNSSSSSDSSSDSSASN